MNLATLTGVLQGLCHDGYAMYDVEILDADGNSFEVPDSITLSKDEEKEIVQISAHHKHGVS